MIISKQKIKNISSVWLVPIVAVFIGFVMIVRYYSNLGETIYLYSSSANGIEAGKTVIKFRDVTIGKVTRVSLDDKYDKVIITAMINKDANNLLVSDASFAIISPRIGLQGVSGLNTLFSGVYIELAPGTQKKLINKFDLKDEPSLIDSQTKGIHLKIKDTVGKKINVGDPVSYKGFIVGTVTSSDFSIKDRIMNHDIFIYSPYDELITTNTKFWIASALDFSFGPSGIDVKVASFDNFVRGGISFAVPPNTELGERVQEGDIFKLYDSEKSSLLKEYKDYIEYILLFKSSVKGLAKGASVEYLGTQIGEVVSAPFDTEYIMNEQESVKIPVLIRIQKERLTNGNDQPDEKIIERIESAIKKGLRGTLESSNLLTDNLFVNLVMDTKNNSENEEIITTYKGYRVIPTKVAGVIEMAEKIELFIDNLNSLNIKAISDNLNNLLGEMIKTADNLKAITDNLKSTTKNENRKSLVDNINKTLEKLQNVLDSYSGNANLYMELNKTLRELNLVLKDVNGLTKQANDKPNMFIFGNDAKDEQPTVNKKK